MELLSVRVNNCTLCEFSESRQRALVGSGCTERPLLAFVGEAPGAVEDQTGVVFTGPSGELLWRMIAALGLTKDEVFLTNALCCRPPQNRCPDGSELKACKPYLAEQLRLVNPYGIVTLGTAATASLTRLRKNALQLRGEITEWEGIPVLVSLHPAFLMRDIGKPLRRKVFADVQQFLLRARLKHKEDSQWNNPSLIP